jgi:hypothetical protein
MTFEEFCTARGHDPRELTPPLREALEKLHAESIHLAAVNPTVPSITPGDSASQFPLTPDRPQEGLSPHGR